MTQYKSLQELERERKQLRKRIKRIALTFSLAVVLIIGSFILLDSLNKPNDVIPVPDTEDTEGVDEIITVDVTLPREEIEEPTVSRQTVLVEWAAELIAVQEAWKELTSPLSPLLTGDASAYPEKETILNLQKELNQFEQELGAYYAIDDVRTTIERDGGKNQDVRDVEQYYRETIKSIRELLTLGTTSMPPSVEEMAAWHTLLQAPTEVETVSSQIEQAAEVVSDIDPRVQQFIERFQTLHQEYERSSTQLAVTEARLLQFLQVYRP